MNTRSTFILSVLPVIGLLFGCQSGPSKQEQYDAIMKSWLGCQSSDLVAKWGPPQNVMRDRNGEIWTYFYQREWTTPGHSETTSTGSAQTYGSFHSSNIFGPAGYTGDTRSQGNAFTTYTPPQTHGYNARRTFFINEQGKIYRYAWQGL